MIRGDLNRACQLLSDLVSEEPSNQQYLLALARAQRHRLVHALTTRRPSEADQSFQAAVKIMEELVSASPTNPEFMFELADTLSMATTRMPSMEELVIAKGHLDRAIVYSQQLASQFPRVQQYQALLANAYSRLAGIQRDHSHWDEAEAHFETALAGLESLVESSPTAFHQFSLALSARELADLKRQRGIDAADQNQLHASRDILSTTIDRFEKYLEDNVSNFGQRIRSNLYSSLAETYDALGEPERSFEARHQARPPGGGRRMGRPPAIGR